MNGTLKLAAPLVLAVAVSACNAGGSTSLPVGGGQSAATGATMPQWQMTRDASRACNGPRTGGQMQCDALILNRGFGPMVNGWAPTDFQTAYNLPSSSKGAGVKVAIVDAFDNPNVASDLAAYRTQFNLGTAKFTKYNQKGQKKNYPQGNTGWGVEIDLDVQMVSASCPKCTIYLIEANDNYGNNLYAAEKEAVKLGATIISNSWGGGAGSASGGAFSQKGITYLASAGDGGYGMQDPADYDDVLSIGGTLLHKNGSAYTESVWPDSGGGCSVVTKPSWQNDPKCSERTGNDIAAVAYGVALYDTYGNNGWGEVGGTSVSSPLLAGVFGLANNAQQGGKNFWTASSKTIKKYMHTTISGTLNGCPSQYTGTYICDGDTGQYKTYSSPAGWGSPNGIGAF
ncbi:MAG: peptidase S8 [Candidatus Eremiobacteraeota bacterium]|nr:peptidase S8 [Candidatus Eremiobacteraeota bacterium]